MSVYEIPGDSEVSNMRSLVDSEGYRRSCENQGEYRRSLGDSEGEVYRRSRRPRRGIGYRLRDSE